MEVIVWPSFKDNARLICVRKCTGNIALNLLLAIRVNFIPEVNTDCFVEFCTSLQPKQEYLMILCLKWMKSTMTSLKLISRW